MNIAPAILLPPDETVEFFRGKGYALQSRWDETWQEENGRAFTVTKLIQGDLLEKVRASLDKVLSEGGTFEQWKAAIEPELRAAGWWGKVEDAELTGTDKPVFVGSARLRTIYDTNLRMARAAGQWKRIQQLKAKAPYLLYDAVNDRRTRPLHRIWGGLDDGKPIILPVDHPFWTIYFPPCGWGCRCGVIQLSERDLRLNGWSVTTDAELVAKGVMTADGQIGGNMRRWRRSNGEIVMVPDGVDPGFAYNPGVDHLRGLAPAPLTGPIGEPYHQPSPKPPMPAARERDPSVLVDPGATPAQQAIDQFIASFDGPTDGSTVLTRDKLDQPLVIDESFFWRGRNSGDPSAAKLDSGRIEAINLIAETLKDPDEIWYCWVEVTGKDGKLRKRLVRRYVSRFTIGGKQRSYVVVMEFGDGGWHGVTGFKNRRDSYLDGPQVREGTLAYRRQ